MLQLEYAEAATQRGHSVIAAAGKHCAVIVARDLRTAATSHAYPSQVVWHVDENIMMTATGLFSDVRVVVNSARTLCNAHRAKWNSAILPERLATQLADDMYEYTVYSQGARPLAVDVLITTAGSSCGKDASCVYRVQTAGTLQKYRGIAIGAKAKALRESLGRDLSPSAASQQSMEEQTLVRHVLSAFKANSDSEQWLQGLSVQVLHDNGSITEYSHQQLQDLCAALPVLPEP